MASVRQPPIYGYAFPKYQRGEQVVFVKHNHSGIGEGEIVSVETHYDHKNCATHIYSILPYGRQRQQHIAERFVVRAKDADDPRMEHVMASYGRVYLGG